MANEKIPLSEGEAKPTISHTVFGPDPSVALSSSSRGIRRRQSSTTAHADIPLIEHEADFSDDEEMDDGDGETFASAPEEFTNDEEEKERKLEPKERNEERKM